MSESYFKKCLTKVVSEISEIMVWSVFSSGLEKYLRRRSLSLRKFEGNAFLFCAFDGHNGAEVAKFMAKKLPQIIL